MVLGTAGSGSCLISLIPACLGAPLLEFGTVGAATAPVLVLAPMVTGGMLVFRSCLGSAVGHKEPLEGIIAMSVFCAWCPCPLYTSYLWPASFFFSFSPAR